MKVELERTFPMPAGPDVAWAALLDIETVAACMPGAKITERLDETHYKGTVTVKVGPATLAFRGDIEVKEQDAANRTLRLIAKGTDRSGSSAASLDLTGRVEDAGHGRSNLVGRSEASVSGKAATFGGRMMDTVADQILKQFAANFAAHLEGRQPAPAAIDTPGIPAAPTPDTSGTPASPTPGTSGTPVSPALPSQQPLNGIALLWAVVKDWLRGLFAKKAA